MSHPLVQLSHLSYSFSKNLLLDSVSLSIHRGETFALIGANGSGKTTLLQLISGAVLPDSGEIIRASDLTIGYLPQEISPIECTVRAYLQEGPFTLLEKEMASCLKETSRLEEWGALHERFEALGGYRRLPMEQVLHGLKLGSSLLDSSFAGLSSGQRIRIGLAKALLNNPSLLLLDEPTNHLDSEMVTWLKEMISKREGASLVISHDRAFLNETCNRLLEIEGGKLSWYGGSYDYYLEERKRILEKSLEAYEEEQREKAFLKQTIRAQTFSKGKPTAKKDRNLMAYESRGEQHQKSVERKLDVWKARLAEIEAAPLSHPKPKTITGLHFPPVDLPSSPILQIEGLSKSYGSKKLFSQLYLTLKRGEKVAVTGPNGCGKTTLLRCILGKETGDTGLIQIAPSTRISYLDQEGEFLPMDQTPLEYFQLSEEELRRELHKAGLGGEELLHNRFREMSVGQRKRLLLLFLVQQRPTLLLLDEPTNHLDLQTIEALEKALLGFEGALLAISHDPTFLGKMDRSLELISH